MVSAQRVIAWVTLMCGAVVVRADGPAAGGVITDFDGVPPVVTQAAGLTLTEVRGKDGNQFLRITSADGGMLKGGVVFRLPAGTTPGQAGGLAARVRPGDGTRAKL